MFKISNNQRSSFDFVVNKGFNIKTPLIEKLTEQKDREKYLEERKQFIREIIVQQQNQ
ncbi:MULTISPECIES: hypothetical protein [Staphylococcaceae]|uniref:hypothetical protein n=1 Tax=Staphylococcaceae TaxID=90964 RepID=UPI0012FEDE10|nr:MULTISPECIES: hypothetical protein [Macrococcus]